MRYETKERKQALHIFTPTLALLLLFLLQGHWLITPRKCIKSDTRQEKQAATTHFHSYACAVVVAGALAHNTKKAH
jgi:hypothetical protein